MEYINALRAGTRLGEYEIRDVLGQGGFGLTYLANDTNLVKVVAIKEYLPRDFATRTNTRTVVPNSRADAADYQWGLERFLDEARTLARFDHPHLNKVYRFFEANGTAYLVLEYIDGQTLSHLLTTSPTLPDAHLRRIIAQILSGLEEVHAAGYVHRDIKPSNIMLRGDGSAVLLDFGAARQAVGQRSKSVTSILTPGYAPVEQYDTKAEDVGPWSDLYALGMVAYRCVSGLRDADLPDAVTRSRTQRKGGRDLAPALEVGKRTYDPRFLKAIDWAIQVNEEDRPQDAHGVARGPLRRPGRRRAGKRKRVSRQEWRTAELGVQAGADRGWGGGAGRRAMAAASVCGNGRQTCLYRPSRAHSRITGTGLVYPGRSTRTAGSCGAATDRRRQGGLEPGESNQYACCLPSVSQALSERPVDQAGRDETGGDRRGQPSCF